MCGKRVWFGPRRDALPRYLQQRRRRWYATLDIPKDARPAFDGKPRFLQSLETESLSVAQSRVGLLISKWKREIDAARKADPLEEEIRWWRRHLPTLEVEEQEALEDVLLEKAKEMERREKDGTGVSFYKRATGQVVDTAEHVEEWIGTLTGNEPKTRDMKRSDVLRMAKRFPTLDLIKKPEVHRWANDLVQTEGLAPKTVSRIISHSRGYWSYLQSLQLVPDDTEPFHGVGPKVSRKGKGAKSPEWKPFKPAEVVNLLRAAEAKRGGRGDENLRQLIWLGMWTGCRIEELCALRCEQVNLKEGYFEVEDAKTPAGWRQVPIHSQLRAFMEAAVKKSKDGYVLSELTFNKYEDRSNAVGKRFGHLKRKLGFGDRHVFHSIRKTVTTQLRHAEVPEAVSADIVGHDIPTMTYGLYGKGEPLARKAEALEKISYPL